MNPSLTNPDNIVIAIVLVMLIAGSAWLYRRPVTVGFVTCADLKWWI
jgi:hypothetical protein